MRQRVCGRLANLLAQPNAHPTERNFSAQKSLTNKIMNSPKRMDAVNTFNQGCGARPTPHSPRSE